jgi:adenine-specific DNA methylase
MVATEFTPRERQDALLEAMRRRGYLTVTDAWKVGHELGFYVGGDGGMAKADLTAIAGRNQATRTDGFWRHINEPDRIRLQHKYWSDYWTPR